MRNILLILVLGLFTLSAEDKSKWTEISGEYSYPLWKMESGWQDIETEFKHDKEYLDKITEVKEISFILFTAAWCPDSRVGTPKIIDLLQKTGHYPSKFKMYGLDRDKNEPAGNNYIYEIEKVPTLIVLKDGNEIGRIVEYPEKSWAWDVWEIIKDKKK
jgi:thiol-disulfide isomerase/thioredoxin